MKALQHYQRMLQGSIPTVILSMMAVVLMMAFSGCHSEELSSDTVQQTSLAFHVSTDRAVTRMSDEVTQQKGKAYRGINTDDLWLFPFNNTDGTSLSGNVIANPDDMKQNGDNQKNYYHDNFPEIPSGTSRFLCYARAVPESGEFVNGCLTPSITDADASGVVTTSAITFSPEVIPTSEITFAFINSDPDDENNKNKYDRFIYPPELYYYAFSPIKTSYSHQKDYYDLEWSDVLNRYEKDNATYEGIESSVAIKEPLHYAVGCLQIGLVASASLEDADGKTIPLTSGTDGTFPLTGVFVTGQHTQNYDFTPVTDSSDSEKIIYDKTITGVSMGASQSTKPSTFSNTLVLQTIDGEGVRFALEFQNNSGQAFKGANGTVSSGAKFYLVGSIQVTTGHAGAEAYKNRVFTKDYITQGTIKIKDLKQAYTYLPDLLDPRLEVIIQLEADWIQSTTTNVPL